MANILFKKGSYNEFKSKVLGIAADGTKGTPAVVEGALYLTEDEGGLYLGKSGGQVQRIQGSVLYFDTLAQFTEKVAPPFSTDVIYFIANDNALIRWNPTGGADSTGAWVVLNTTVDSVNAQVTALNNLINTAQQKAEEAYQLADSKTTMKDVEDKNYATTDYVDTSVDTLKGESTDTKDKITVYGAFASAAEASAAAGNALQVANSKTTMAEVEEKGYATVSYVDAQDSKILGKEADDATAITVYGAKKAAAEAYARADKGVGDAAAAKGAADAAQATANTAVGNAKAAHDRADKGVKDAADALAQANKMLPLAGGTMTGPIQMSNGSKITGLADPTAETEAANKKYVDAAKAAASAVGAAAQTTANTALSTANNALPKAGGTMIGSIDMNKQWSIKNLADLTEKSDGQMAANKNYVDAAISTAIAANDAMTFVGVLGTGDGQTKALPTTANVGDTYKVGVAGKYGTIVAKVGDLIINGAADDGTPAWIHISSGYEDDYLQKLAVSDNGIYLTDGVNNTSSAGFVSGIDFVGNDNISIAITAGTGNTPTHTVTASMVWGTF